MESTRAPPFQAPDAAPRAFAYKGSLDPGDPGSAAPGAPSKFFGGMHSSGLTKNFADPNILSKSVDLGSLRAQIDAEERATRRREMREQLDDHTKAKQEQALERAAEKRKDLEQLQTYNPWGKPGNGAPREKTTLVSGELTLAKQLKTAPPGYVEKSFGKAGNGAPIRTTSGHVKANVPFEVERPLMPNITVDPQYGQELKQQVETRKAAKEERRAHSAELAAAESSYSPYGKPGAGAPIKTNEGILATNRTKKLENDISTKPAVAPINKQLYSDALRKQVDEHDALKRSQTLAMREPTSYDPWGKGSGQPIRNPEGNVVRPKHLEQIGTAMGESLVESLGKPGGGAPFDRTAQPTIIEPQDVYHPFGKSGAGAPIKTETGQLTTKVTGAAELEIAGVLFQREKENKAAKTAYLQELKAEIVEKQQTTLLQTQELRSTDDPQNFYRFGQGYSNPKRDPTTGELSPMKRTKTDVVTYKEEGLGRRDDNDPSSKQALSTELAKQTHQRAKTYTEIRQQELALERKHVATDGNWQGQGQGAPKRNDQGEVHGRKAGYETELHLTEPLNDIRRVPLEKRVDYLTDLDRQAEQKNATKKAQRKMSSEQATKSSMARAFGKPGAGAPLVEEGKIVTSPTKISTMTKEAQEYKVTAKPAHKVD